MWPRLALNYTGGNDSDSFPLPLHPKCCGYFNKRCIVARRGFSLASWACEVSPYKGIVSLFKTLPSCWREQAEMALRVRARWGQRPPRTPALPLPSCLCPSPSAVSWLHCCSHACLFSPFPTPAPSLLLPWPYFSTFPLPVSLSSFLILYLLFLAISHIHFLWSSLPLSVSTSSIFPFPSSFPLLPPLSLYHFLFSPSASPHLLSPPVSTSHPLSSFLSLSHSVLTFIFMII